jgi:hypothetical protein
MEMTEPEHDKPLPPDLTNAAHIIGLLNQLSLADSLPAHERSTAIQVIGEDIEQKAKLLIKQTRAYRGIPIDDRPALTLVSTPEPKKAPDLASRMRDAMRTYASGFTLNELATELEVDVKVARRLLKPYVESEKVKDTGARMGRGQVIYEYVGSQPVPEKVEKIKHRPPEKDPPAFVEARATGTAVRVAAMEKLTRRGRSTPGTSHKHRMRDRQYERMQEAKEKRAEEQRFKALLEQQKGKKK